MFTDKMKTIKMFGVAAIALLMMCSGVFILAGGEYDAESIHLGDADYEYAEVSVAPDYKWQYPIEFPADLDAETELYVDTDHTDSFIANQLTDIDVSDRTINLSFAGATVDQTYKLVLKAVHTPSSQTTYQAIKFAVVDGMSITPTSGALGTNFVVDESGSDAFTFTVKTAIGKIVEGSISVKIDGSEATFTPTKVTDTEYTVKVTADTATAGKKTVVVTASNELSEEASSTTTYIVYDKIVAEDVVIEAYSENGKTVWNLDSEQTNSSEDAKVEVLASYMHIDKPELENYRSNGDSTLTRTGAPSAPISMKYVIYVVTTNMVGHAQQEAYVDLYVYDEPDFTLSPSNTEITTYNKMTPVPINFTVDTDTLDKTWTITPSTGVTFDTETGVATIDKDSDVGTYTVEITTPSGQSETSTIVVNHEIDFTISGSTTLNPVVTGSASNVEVRTYDYAIDPADFPSDVTWSIKSNSDPGVDASIVDGVLSLKSASPVKNVTIVLHAETACGNYADLEVTVNFYNVLSFNAPPTTGAFAYATNPDE